MSTPVWKSALWSWFATHHGVVSEAVLHRLGVSRSTIERMIARSELLRIAPGVYRSAAYPMTLMARMVAVCLRNPSAIVSFTTGCSMWGLRGMPAESVIHVLVPHGSSPEIEGVVVHRCRKIDAVDIVQRPDGIRLASPPRCLFDASDMIGQERCASALEQVLDRYCTFPTIVSTLLRLGHPSRPGTRTLAAVIARRESWQAAMQSDLECRVLNEIRAQGLPEPVCQYPLTLPGGARVRLDFAWPEQRVALEVDHPFWHAGDRPVHRDKGRDRRAATIGWQTLRVTDLDVNGPLAAEIADVAVVLDLRRAS